jgi:hypothetical protein
MTIIRALYMEDEETDFEKYTPVLERAWNRNPNLKNLGTLEWDWEKSLPSAIEALKEKGGEYTLFCTVP